MRSIVSGCHHGCFLGGLWQTIKTDWDNVEGAVELDGDVVASIGGINETSVGEDDLVYLF